MGITRCCEVDEENLVFRSRAITVKYKGERHVSGTTLKQMLSVCRTNSDYLEF